MIRRAALVVAALGLAACGATEAASPPAPTGTIGGVGELPGPLAVDGTATTSTEAAVVSTSPRSTEPRRVGAVAEQVEGNRVIVIGDSILASTARRYGGDMCAALVPLDWAVEVDAESGRFIDFLDRVLDRRLRPEEGIDWDAAVIGLGSNFDGDVPGFMDDLQEGLDRLAPRPVVLLTVTERRQDQVRLNEELRALAGRSDRLHVVDWAAITAAEPTLLQPDGIHLGDDGRGRLAFEVAAVLGSPPATTDPECLSTEFDDDSAIAGGSSGSSGTTTTTRPRPAASTTTTRPAGGTSTTRPSGSTTTTTSATSTTTGGTGTTTTTTATTTATTATTPATTAPATTAAVPAPPPADEG